MMLAGSGTPGAKAMKVGSMPVPAQFVPLLPPSGAILMMLLAPICDT
jgi:hypothetical protein